MSVSNPGPELSLKAGDYFTHHAIRFFVGKSARRFLQNQAKSH